MSYSVDQTSRFVRARARQAPGVLPSRGCDLYRRLMTTADDPYGGGGAEDDDGDDGTAPSSSSTSPTALPTICFVTPLKKLRLSPAFALQKGDGGQDARRPVKVIGDDAHEEEPAKEVSCCMVNYSPFASPAVLLPHHGVNNSFSSHGLLRFDTLTAAQQNVVGEGKEDHRFVKVITADTRAESAHKEGVTSAMVSSMLCCITLPHYRADWPSASHEWPHNALFSLIYFVSSTLSSTLFLN